MSETQNLLNATEHKTRMTIMYLSMLNPRPIWGPAKCAKCAKFAQAIKSALVLPSANAMLDAIGYDPKKEPRLYKEIDMTNLE